MTQLVEKPVWPLSSYGASKYELNLLYQLDESPEELRTKYVAAMKAGNLNEYVSTPIRSVESRFHFVSSYNTSPAGSQTQRKPTSAFGKPSGSVFPSTSSAFGGTTSTPSAFASTSSAFGNTPTQGSSAFGNPAPANSVFGSTTTPSAFGSTNPTTSAFGSTSTPTSAFGSTTTPSAFGSTTTPSAFSKPASAFGQPAFGQPAFGQTGFGTPTPATTSAFGQPQNTTTPVSAFSQPAQTTTTSAFGQPAFGQPSFGQTSQPTSSVIKPASGAFSAFAGTGASPFGSTATSTPASGSGGGGFSAFAGSTPSAFGSTTVTPSSTSGSTLPADYADILPQDAILAFKEAKFEFGSVPEWVPPVSVR
ncbi:hypothetical protein BDN70DRAFT_811804 [Pholiota conissans]|uniref:Uncharacterized protein n=1 Tax=Pholiota conissans TaxID=109636 RepID=A0A9P5YXY7_9AGAR|nr:hypothetical protein BDN70DRAFT_811804 [Pholiota conissans]